MPRTSDRRQRFALMPNGRVESIDARAKVPSEATHVCFAGDTAWTSMLITPGREQERTHTNDDASAA
jgi:hypothetical protein